MLTALAERHHLRLTPARLDAFELVPHETPGGDLARVLAMEDLYRERRLALVPRHPLRARPVPATLRTRRTVRVYETGERRRPRAVVLHDSFGLALIPYLAEHFERTVFVEQRDLTVEVIEAERPDVVIHEIAERTLVVPPRDDLTPRGDGRPGARVR